ncbi:hypothetical protein [Bacillus halotolerans]|uniref:hypothetical protein n=1 Tax=Bacillus halotolerans TaxID=260554 RepID=UPI00398E73CC
MWKYEYTAISDAAPEEIWKYYQHPESWKQWDAGITSASLNGPFQNETEGALLLRGNTVPFWLEHVEKHQSFSVISHLPNTNVKMEFYHVLQKRREGLNITHGVVLEGAEAKKWGEKIGQELSKDIPESVNCLVRLCKGMLK